MNRLVSLVMLVAFAAQHMMCCCTGMTADSCDHDHFAAEPICAIEHHPVDNGSHVCDHEHSAPSSPETLGHESCPGEHPHQHHYCIGTHVFFLSAPRAEISQAVTNLDFGFGQLDFSVHVAMTTLATASHRSVDSAPPLSSCPQRSALCVYRI